MKVHSAKLLAGASVLACLASAAVAPASAQTTAARSSIDTAAQEREIIVTAQKQSQSLDRAATAIVAVRGEDLQASGVSSARDISGITPGVTLTQLGSAVNVNVRGVGSSQFSPLGGSAVGFVLDGVPLEGNIGLTNGLYDLERVEVLKGPQGTIYGLDATGGVIAVVTARPKIGENSGSLDAEYGNYDHFKVTGNVNVALAPQLAARVSGTYNRRDGYISSTYEDADEGGLRGQLLYKADTWSLLLAGDYFHEGGIGAGAVALPLGRGTPDGDPFHSNYYTNQGTDARRDNTFWGVRAELNADLGFARLTVLPAYRKIETDEIQYMSSYRAHVTNDISQTSVEARLTGDVGPVDWMVGGYSLWAKRTYKGFFYNPSGDLTDPVPLSSFVDPRAVYVSANGIYSRTPKESLAAFGQLTWSVASDFRLVGGLRFSHDKRSVDPNTGYLLNTTNQPPFLSSFIPLADVGGIAQAPGEGFTLESLAAQNPSVLYITTQSVSRSATFEHLDFKIGAQFDITPEVMLYTNLSTGYKSGGVNTYSSGTIGGTYKPETLTALEGGVRAHLGKLRLHANGYYWWYKNHQEGAIYNLPGVGTQLLIENLPAGHMYGLDIEAGWRPTAHDTLGLQFAWMESNTGPFTVGPSGLGQVVETKGHEYVSAPRWTINGDYEHNFVIGDYELSARAEGHYQSRSNLEIRFNPATEQPGYFTGNAFLTLSPSSKGWYIGAYVRNFTDKVYIVAAQKAPGLLPDFWGNLGAPRTYGIRAGIDF